VLLRVEAIEARIADQDAAVRREAEQIAGSVPSSTGMLPLGELGPDVPRLLILTPLKDAAPFLRGYVDGLARLTYPRAAISIGFLESDSGDDTFALVEALLPELRARYRRAALVKHDFHYQVPDGLHRGHPSIQMERRTILARSRNRLLSHALGDEAWVLWLDVDVVEYPSDLIEQLIATGKEIVQPHCVLDPGGPTFDTNGWRDHGRLHLDDLRDEGRIVKLDAVGGTVLLVRADLHREGLVFPTFPYGEENPLRRPERGELETEGLGIMARDMGYQAWGMPHLEVIHARH
jgi:peptide chain release factor subunit 1